MSFWEDLGNFGHGAVDGFQKGQSIGREYEDEKSRKLERAERKRVLDEEAKKRKQELDIEQDVADDVARQAGASAPVPEVPQPPGLEAPPAVPPAQLAAQLGGMPQEAGAPGAQDMAAMGAMPAPPVNPAMPGPATPGPALGAIQPEAPPAAAGPQPPVPPAAAGQQPAAAGQPPRTPFGQVADISRRKFEAAQRRGYTDLARQFAKQHTDAVLEDTRGQIATFERDRLPTLQSIQKQIDDANLKKLPIQLDNAQQQVLAEAADIKRKRFGVGIYDALNSLDPSMRAAAAKSVGESLGIQGVAGFKVSGTGNNRMVIPVDANGQGFPDPSKKGKSPIQFDFGEAMNAANAAMGIKDSEKLTNLGAGDMLVSSRGGRHRVVAHNPKPDNPDKKEVTAPEMRARIDGAKRDLAKAMNIEGTYDPVKQMMIGGNPQLTSVWLRLSVKMAQEIENGKSPTEAAAEAYRRFELEKLQPK